MTGKIMETNNTLSFDPMAWLSQPASQKPASSVVSQPAVSQISSPADELAMAKAVTNELLRLGANIAEDYDEYLKLGFALANGLGSEGRNLYHMLCAQSTKYRMADCEQKWRECLRKADGRTGIATFYHMARQAGVNINTIARKYRYNHY